MNPRRAPPRVRLRHRANQRPDVGGHGRSPDATSAVPSPPESKASPVPGDDGLRLHDDERCSPSGPEAREHDPEPTVGLRKPQPSRPGSLQHLQLVSQGQYFELQRGARMRPRSQGQEEGREHRHHRPAAYPSSTATSTAATRTDISVGTPGEYFLRVAGRSPLHPPCECLGFHPSPRLGRPGNHREGRRERRTMLSAVEKTLLRSPRTN
jgi:hypothetical protein